MGATTVLVGGLFMPKRNEIKNSNDSNNVVVEDVKPNYNNMIYYASETEDTGASEADSKEQGGALFVGNGSTISLSNNASITDHMGKYGGAVYVASGGTFNMTGGTITGNYAKYGGAIYIESGGVCNLSGGLIEVNEAESGTAIFVEDGGELNITGDVSITGNIEGEWGYLVFDGVRYRNFEDFYKIYDTINPDNYESFNYDIYGTVYHDYVNTKNNNAWLNGLNFKTGKDVNINGCYDSENSDDVPNIITDGVYVSVVFRAVGGNLTFSNIVFDDIRTSDSGTWEWYYFKPNCVNLVIDNCVFNEGLVLNEVTDATITNTTFNSITSSHYAFWIGSSGYSSYASYSDYVETCILDNCVFTGYRAIKILSSEADITLKNIEFIGIEQKCAIVNDVDVSWNNIDFYDIKVKDCLKGFISSYENLYIDVSNNFDNYNYEYDGGSGGVYHINESYWVNFYSGNEIIGFLFYYEENPYYMDFYEASKVIGDKYGNIHVYGLDGELIFEYISDY